MEGGVVNMLSVVVRTMYGVVVRTMYGVVVRTPLNNRHEWDTSRLPAHSRWRDVGLDAEFRPCYWETGEEGQKTNYEGSLAGIVKGGTEVRREETLFPGYYDDNSDDWGKKWVRETDFSYGSFGLKMQGAEDVYVYMMDAVGQVHDKVHVSHQTVGKTTSSIGASAIIGVELLYSKESKSSNSIKK